jgi:L-2-hydroxyglutarate oxidase
MMQYRRVHDVAIVGGGIVGLATAHRLMTERPGLRLVVVEKEPEWAAHQTGHNSGVIHSGIYYRPGSLKARMCRDGNQSMVEFAARHGIPHEVCGKLIVATSERELAPLDELREHADRNGIPVRVLDARQVRELEPEVTGIRALHVASTGIIDFRAVCRELAAQLEQLGADLRTATTVTGIADDPAAVTVTTDHGSVKAKVLVNCAGLHSDRIARLAGVDPGARIVPFRGEYYELREERSGLVRNLVYPVPDPDFPFLGVHFTRMVHGGVHVGPNAVLAASREGYRWRDIRVRDLRESLFYRGFRRLARQHAAEGAREVWRSLSKRSFARSARRLVPAVRAGDLVRAGSGVRAQALGPDGNLIDDFLIVQGTRTVHVCNAPSPAATAALEIGRHVADLVHSAAEGSSL